MPQSRQPTLPGLSPQSLVAHRVPLKPYAAPVPRSQSLQDQPTRNLAAFPAAHDPDPAVPAPTATPSARGAVIRQNSDPTSEGPGPSPSPPAWVRPDNEAPPKVRTAPQSQGRAEKALRRDWRPRGPPAEEKGPACAGPCPDVRWAGRRVSESGCLGAERGMDVPRERGGRSDRAQLDPSSAVAQR